jgi:ketosteroid isomerase-like protein
MHKYTLAFVFALLLALPAGASDLSDVMSVVHLWADGFNSADAKSVIATCADETAVIDDFPPHEWHGPGACKRWFGDFESMSKSTGITNPRIAVATASHSEISKEFAYVVVPVMLSFERNGTPVKDKGILTLTLQNGTSGWRITGWVWSDQ